MKSKSSKLLFALILLLAILAAPAAFAYGQVTVNGVTYGCQNSCMVMRTDRGDFVYDTKGGEVREIIVWEDAEVPEDP